MKRIAAIMIASLFVLTAFAVLEMPMAKAATPTQNFSFPYEYGTPQVPSDVGAQGIQGPTVPQSDIGPTVPLSSIGFHGHIGPYSTSYIWSTTPQPNNFVVYNGTPSSSVPSIGAKISIQNITCSQSYSAVTSSSGTATIDAPYGYYYMTISAPSGRSNFTQIINLRGQTITRYLAPTSTTWTTAVNNGPSANLTSTLITTSLTKYGYVFSGGINVLLLNNSNNNVVIATAITASNGSVEFTNVNIGYSYYLEFVFYDPAQQNTVIGAPNETQYVGTPSAGITHTGSVSDYIGAWSTSAIVTGTAFPTGNSASWSVTQNTTVDSGTVSIGGYLSVAKGFSLVFSNDTILFNRTNMPSSDSGRIIFDNSTLIGLPALVDSSDVVIKQSAIFGVFTGILRSFSFPASGYINSSYISDVNVQSTTDTFSVHLDNDNVTHMNGIFADFFVSAISTMFYNDSMAFDLSHMELDLSEIDGGAITWGSQSLHAYGMNATNDYFGPYAPQFQTASIDYEFFNMTHSLIGLNQFMPGFTLLSGNANGSGASPFTTYEFPDHTNISMVNFSQSFVYGKDFNMTFTLGNDTLVSNSTFYQPMVAPYYYAEVLMYMVGYATLSHDNFSVVTPALHSGSGFMGVNVSHNMFYVTVDSATGFTADLGTFGFLNIDNNTFYANYENATAYMSLLIGSGAGGSYLAIWQQSSEIAVKLFDNTFDAFPGISIASAGPGGIIAGFFSEIENNVFYNDVSTGPAAYMYNVKTMARADIQIYQKNSTVIKNNYFLHLNQYVNMPVMAWVQPSGVTFLAYQVIHLEGNFMYYSPLPSSIKIGTQPTVTNGYGSFVYAQINNIPTSQETPSSNIGNTTYVVSSYQPTSPYASFASNYQLIYNLSYAASDPLGTLWLWGVAPDVNTLSGIPTISYSDGLVGGPQPNFTWDGYKYTESVEPTYIQVGVNSANAPPVNLQFNGAPNTAYSIAMYDHGKLIDYTNVTSSANGVVTFTYNPATMPLDPVFELTTISASMPPSTPVSNTFLYLEIGLIAVLSVGLVIPLIIRRQYR